MDFRIGDCDKFEFDPAAGPCIAHVRVDPVATGCALHEFFEKNDGFVDGSLLSYYPVGKQ